MAQKPPKSPGILPFPALKHPVVAPEPPRALKSYGRALWDAVTAEFDFSDIAGRELLCQACAQLDRVEAMREQIDEEGELLETEHSNKAHPLLQAELSGRAFVCRTLSRLGLPYEPIRSPGRPPSSRA